MTVKTMTAAEFLYPMHIDPPEYLTSKMEDYAAYRVREALEEKGKCKWTEDDDWERELWATECGAEWVFEDSPIGEDNIFCSKCGNLIEFIPSKEKGK